MKDDMERNISESKSKTKVRSRWPVFLILLMSEQLFTLKKLCVETRLCNISKTTNTTRLTKTFLNGSLNALSETFSLNSLKQLV